MRIPLIARYHPTVTRSELARVTEVAEKIRIEHEQLATCARRFHEQQVREPIDDSPTLHLDDFSEQPVFGGLDNSGILQQRARLRAADQDWVALTLPIEDGFSDYCEYTLGLGRVNWIGPAVVPSSTNLLAFECGQDRLIRHELTRAIRRAGMRYIHPHVSTLQVWELADLLYKNSRRPVQVIGPPPALSTLVNDKIEFSRMAAELLGEQFLPRTEVAYNFATLSKKIKELAGSHTKLGIKFPFGVGGQGNFLVDTQLVRGRDLAFIRNYLKDLVESGRWPESGRVLIDVWETDVICSPSVQTWIPPHGHGAPIVEGLFAQSIYGEKGHFGGAHLVTLPENLAEQIVNQSYLLCMLVQELGYVGRCSFDLILAGESMENCRIEFIESNARWGGTSCPMTLINRIIRDQSGMTYGFRRVHLPGLDQFNFSEVLRKLGSRVFNPATGKGSFVLMNPGRIRNQSTLDTIALGKNLNEVNRLLSEQKAGELYQLIHRHTGPDESTEDRMDVTPCSRSTTDSE